MHAHKVSQEGTSQGGRMFPTPTPLKVTLYVLTYLVHKSCGGTYLLCMYVLVLDNCRKIVKP